MLQVSCADWMTKSISWKVVSWQCFNIDISLGDLKGGSKKHH